MTGALAELGFDYASLAPDVAGEARTAADRIRALGQRQNETIVAIGEELIAIKDKLGHGHFGDWIKAEFGMSADTAERYMRVAAALNGKIRTVRILKPTTLYALTAKATPSAVRSEIIERIEAGEEVSDSEVCGTVRHAVTKTRKMDLKDRRLPTRRSSPKVAEPPQQARSKAIVAFSNLLHRSLPETLEDLSRILSDERPRIADIALSKRVVLARKYLNALGVRLGDLQPIESGS